MRWLVGVVVVAMTSRAVAAPPSTLIADVTYSFVDQNGVGWVTVDGSVTVTIALSGKEPSLKMSGKHKIHDGVLVAGKPGGPPDMRSRVSEGTTDESHPLHDVVVSGSTVTFKLDPTHDHLEGSCAPAKISGLASTTLYECTITGFQWRAVANTPALHHPFVLDANPSAKTRILNTMSGKSKAGFGQRKLGETKPVPKPPPKP